MSGRRTLIKVASVLATAASVAGVAVAATTGAPPAPPPAVPQDRSAQTVTAADATQEATMGVLRRAVGRGDTLPQAARDHVARGAGPSLGANPALARLALTTPLGEQLYVVPARGWVCLTSSEARGTCTPTDRVAEGYAVSLRPIPSGFRLSGLVPDGVDRVEVRGDGQVGTAAPAGNAWQTDVAFEPKAVAWTGPNGERVVPVSAPPPAPVGPAAPETVLAPPAAP
ncbi:MAG TPA: hypothetical protein VK501_27270 [Baekduia sp.]|uniref:hypothetical protein n=1 Tax=Baekduia sp. TaxID=2600305 RepID=UPI002B8216C6|nr:hypothetical protein [Baekduia sp.]HMJ37637.1 hypothetical protein [Baekduia sp.]